MSFSDNNCYLEVESVTAAPFCWNFSWFVLFPALSTSGERLLELCHLQIHEDGNWSVMVFCEFALKALLTSEIQEVFRLGQSSRTKGGSHNHVPWSSSGLYNDPSFVPFVTPESQLLIQEMGDWQHTPHERCFLLFGVPKCQRHYLKLQSVVNQSHYFQQSTLIRPSSQYPPP